MTARCRHCGGPDLPPRQRAIFDVMRNIIGATAAEVLDYMPEPKPTLRALRADLARMAAKGMIRRSRHAQPLWSHT